MNKFINQTEAAAVADNPARIETHTEDGATIIYAGNPEEKDLDQADNGPWIIRRTTVTESDSTTLIETVFAFGRWQDKESLTYKYI